MPTGAWQPPVAKPVPSSSPWELGWKRVHPPLHVHGEKKQPRYLPGAGARGTPRQGIAPGSYSNVCCGLTTLPLLIARWQLP